MMDEVSDRIRKKYLENKCLSDLILKLFGDIEKKLPKSRVGCTERYIGFYTDIKKKHVVSYIDTQKDAILLGVKNTDFEGFKEIQPSVEKMKTDFPDWNKSRNLVGCRLSSGENYSMGLNLLLYAYSNATDICFEIPASIDIDNDIENSSDSISSKEDGSETYRISKNYERNPKNRHDALKIHGLCCNICGFNFEERYGSHGKDFIEVHHKTPLFTLHSSTLINPQEDLTTICSNCHRIIHRDRKNPLTIEKMKEIIRH